MFAQAFRTPDLRKKLLFTLGIIVVYRFGSSLPAPGISAANVRYCSGQLLTEVIPRLHTLKDEGRAGQAKLTQYTRYLTVLLTVLVSAGYVQLARSGSLFSGSACSAANHPLIPHPDVLTIATMVITMVSGTAVIMWMGELVTDRGVGNGMSVMIFTSVIAGIFGQLEQIYLTRGIPMTLMLAAVVIAVIDGFWLGLARRSIQLG